MTKDKPLKEKAVKIQGKDYILVSDRIIYFNEEYPNGMITADLLTDFESKQIVIKATIYPDVDKKDRYFTGYAQEIVGNGFINKTSALENAETSAIGRALAMMGIGVIDSIASVDEINKAKGIDKKQQAYADGYKDAETIEAYCSVCGERLVKGSYGLYCPNYKSEGHKDQNGKKCYKAISREEKEGKDIKLDDNGEPF